MKQSDIEQLKEVVKRLREAGIDAQLCDTPVPVSGNGAVCGIPQEICDQYLSDYMLLPKALVGSQFEMFIPATGNSMCDAGIEEGDQLRVRFGMTARDGDIVLAWIDGRCTVKSFYTDDDGRKWLVPQNEDYDAILLTEEMDVDIMGVVVAVEKSSPRTPTRALRMAVRQTKNKLHAARKLSEEEVDELIVKMGEEVAHARQWFSVYKAMAEYKVQTPADYRGFCNRVTTLLPNHGHLPVAKEIGRMETGCFAQPISMWEESTAPVKGARFYDYKRIAQLMKTCLAEAKLPPS